MKLKIVQLGDLVLRQPSQPLTEDEIHSDSIQQLIAHMRDTMRDAPGVGLAAPQLGIPLQLAVIEDRAEYHQGIAEEELQLRERRPIPFHVLINPRIIDKSGTTCEFFEGCLSFAGFMALTPRARTVKVDYLDESGAAKTVAASGWYARILQHEIDHLRGVVYVDRMHTRTLTTLENFNRHWKQRSPQEISGALLEHRTET